MVKLKDTMKPQGMTQAANLALKFPPAVTSRVVMKNCLQFNVKKKCIGGKKSKQVYFILLHQASIPVGELHAIKQVSILIYCHLKLQLKFKHCRVYALPRSHSRRKRMMSQNGEIRSAETAHCTAGLSDGVGWPFPPDPVSMPSVDTGKSPEVTTTPRKDRQALQKDFFSLLPMIYQDPRSWCLFPKPQF